MKDASGCFVWKAPLVAGQQTGLAKVFGVAGDWKWRVAMYNAKFKPVTLPFLEASNGWSAYSNFSTAVGQQQESDDHGFGSVKVTVKYAGPAKVLDQVADLTKTAGKVRVQAFTTPDFSGVPEAETLVTVAADLTNTADIRANATLSGLKTGATYYVRAYVDSDGNLEKDAWESWGGAKAGVEIISGKAVETVAVWIEDADTDGDWLPDAWEFASYGNLTTKDAEIDPEGKIVYSVTYNDITDGKANISTTLSGASLTFFENIGAAKLLLGFGSDAREDTIAAIREAVEKKIDPSTVKVTSLVVDATNKQVILTVTADVADSIAGSLLSPVYTLPTTAKVYVDIYKKASLVDPNWVYVNTYEKEVSTALDAKITVPVTEDFTSGFYKVEVREKSNK